MDKSLNECDEIYHSDLSLEMWETLHYVRGTEMIIPSCSTDLEDGHDGGAKRGQFYTQTLKGFFFEKGKGEGRG